MSEEEKRMLQQQLWNIANTLRGKMGADEFRDYILGFIFYKYLSEKIHIYANTLLEEDGIDYADIDDATEDGRDMVEAVAEEAVAALGYTLKPSELFKNVAKRGNANEEGASSFILGDLATILKNIENSTMGTESEDDFDNLFEDLDLTSSKLGKTEGQKNELIAKVLAHLDNINFNLGDKDKKADVLGDAYEYLIGQFASGAGKKAGEFYTPQTVSTILAKLVTRDNGHAKGYIKSVYDPTCGSGSLLLRVAKEVKEVAHFYGQELNRTTYNLARMNMILHDVNYKQFDIRQEDTLEHPQHSLDARFEAIVANPPFSVEWSANPLHMSDDRFSQYGKLAPKSKADLAFVQHMVHHLADNGTLAVVMPHGVLFRGAPEGHIRRYLIEERNLVDAVIGLPANIFYGTTTSTCILVLKKCRTAPNNILFIDASAHFEKGSKKNSLRQEDVEKIISSYDKREFEDKYSYVAGLKEVAKNGYSLNIQRYIDLLDKELLVNINDVASQLEVINESSKKADETISSYCETLGLPKPVGSSLTLLTQYKKSVVQMIFSQKVRFTDDNGCFYPDWEEQELGEILSYEQPTKYLVESSEYSNDYDIPVLTAGKTFVLGYTNEKDGIFEALPVIIFDDFTTAIKYVDFPFKAKSSAMKMLKLINADSNLNFIYEAMKLIRYSAASHKRYWISEYQFLPILLPCFEEQQKIVTFLSSIDAKISLIEGQTYSPVTTNE